MIRGLKFAGIPVRNQDAALTFYTEALGFRITTDQEFGHGMRWIELAIPGADTAIVLFTPPGHEDRIGTFHSLSFWCDDVRATVELLRAKGVPIVEEPQTQNWGTSAIIADPEDNRFVLSSR